MERQDIEVFLTPAEELHFARISVSIHETTLADLYGPLPRAEVDLCVLPLPVAEPDLTVGPTTRHPT